MRAHRIFWLEALCALSFSFLGCNSVLGIEEKQRGQVTVDAGDAGGVDSGSDDGASGDGTSVGGGSFALSIVKPPARADGTQPSIRVVRGSTAVVELALARTDGFAGTVTVLVSGLGRGITVAPVIVPPSETAALLTIRADGSAELGPMSLSIIGAHDNLVQGPLAVPVIVQDAPGTLDTTFGNGGKVVVPVGSGTIGPGGIQLLPNGSIVLCGHGKKEGVDSSVAVSRILASGALDPAFALGVGAALGNSPGSNADSCAAVFLRPNGGIVFTGFATPTAGQPRAMLAGRYRPDGFPDQNFGTPSGGFGTTPLDGMGAEGYCVVGPTEDDTFVVGGIGRGHPALLRFNKNGQLDSMFGSETKQELMMPGGIRWLTRQTTGHFVAAIESSTLLVARFSSDGALDTTFGDNGLKSVAAGGQSSSAAVVLAQADDSIVVVGTETLAAGATDIALARLTKSGQPDPVFGIARLGTVHFAGASIVSSAVESEGAFFVAGQTSTDAGPAFTVVGITSEGLLDANFGTGGRQVLGVGMAQAITVDDLGRIIVAGHVGGPTEGSVVVYRLWP